MRGFLSQSSNVCRKNTNEAEVQENTLSWRNCRMRLPVISWVTSVCLGKRVKGLRFSAIVVACTQHLCHLLVYIYVFFFAYRIMKAALCYILSKLGYFAGRPAYEDGQNQVNILHWELELHGYVHIHSAWIYMCIVQANFKIKAVLFMSTWSIREEGPCLLSYIQKPLRIYRKPIALVG